MTELFVISKKLFFYCAPVFGMGIAILVLGENVNLLGMIGSVGLIVSFLDNC